MLQSPVLQSPDHELETGALEHRSTRNFVNVRGQSGCLTMNFKIHSICTAKNEGDIIEYCIRQALKWSDSVIVYDGESTDGTWEKVVALGREDRRVIPWKQDGKVFQESLRSEVFNAFRHTAEENDWWCHLDADEFYPEDIREFLGFIRRPYHVVWGIPIEYYLTHGDLEKIDFYGPISDILSELRYYRIENKEIRFFRHRRRLRWKIDRGWPSHMGLPYPKPVIYRHYKYRSPHQIEKRLETRMSNKDRGFPGWENVSGGRWQDKIEDREKLRYDKRDGKIEIDPALIRGFRDPFYRHGIKWLMHTTGIWP